MELHEEDLNRCIGCGICLGSCPTYRVTGLETAGPRGRIVAMRALASGDVLAEDATFGRLMEECVQCRACEAVCPSQVPFGRMMEAVRERRRASVGPVGVRARAVGAVLSWGLRSRLFLFGSAVTVALAQFLHLDRLLPPALRVGIRVRLLPLLRPFRPVRRGRASVSFFRGCVMDVWQRSVHRDAVSVLAAAGLDVDWPDGRHCCGALHIHQGRHEEAAALARDVVTAFPGEGRIVVDSAGCGAALKEYGQLLGTPEAHAFSARVVDFSEVEEVHALRTQRADRPVIGYQHACHLRNVQGVGTLPLHLLRDVAGCEVVEGEEPGVCCGAGGAYSMLQPELATAIRDRKAACLAGPEVVVTTNPGCHMHLAAAGLPMRHLAEVLAERLDLR